MITILIYLAVYLCLLILGAWCVSEGGDILGDKYDATIIGGFVIAWLNTAPETIFFITALETGNPNFAVGAISGSVIVVCTVAVGACIYIGANARKNGIILLQPGVRQQALILGASLVVMIALLVLGPSFYLGVFGLLTYAAFLLYTITRKTSTPTSTSVGSDLTFKENEEVDEDDDDGHDQPTWKGIAYLACGGLLIYLFSEPFISNVVSLGKNLGMGPLALAFFFAPVASEAPEILESISLSRKGKMQNINIAFANLVGGTISKTTLLTGLLCIYSVNRNYEWVSPAYTISMFLVLVCAASTAAFGLRAEHKAYQGMMLIGLFLFCGLVQFIVAYTGGSDASLSDL